MGISYRAYQEKANGHNQWRLEELVRFREATGTDFKIKIDGKNYLIAIKELESKPKI